MIDSNVIFIITTIGGFVLAGIFAFLYFYCKNKTLPKTVEEWKEVLSVALSSRDAIEKKLKEVIAFFNPESPMSETSLETIEEDIPANSWQMTEESMNRILATCESEEEKSRIAGIVFDYENPTIEGEECCIYTIETTGAIFEVQYGVPELIKDKTAEYNHLTIDKLSDICELVGKENEFLCMANIMDKERKHIKSYELTYGDTTIYIEDGQYRV